MAFVVPDWRTRIKVRRSRARCPSPNPHAAYLFAPLPAAAEFPATHPFRRGLHRGTITRQESLRPTTVSSPGSRTHDPPLAAPSGPAGRSPRGRASRPRRRSARAVAARPVRVPHRRYRRHYSHQPGRARADAAGLLRRQPRRRQERPGRRRPGGSQLARGTSRPDGRRRSHGTGRQAGRRPRLRARAVDRQGAGRRRPGRRRSHGQEGRYPGQDDRNQRGAGRGEPADDGRPARHHGRAHGPRRRRRRPHRSGHARNARRRSRRQDRRRDRPDQRPSHQRP